MNTGNEDRLGARVEFRWKRVGPKAPGVGKRKLIGEIDWGGRICRNEWPLRHMFPTGSLVNRIEVVSQAKQ